ncbi:MAG: hypothetical protein MJA27_22630 [Pseudanabaenales cyanobacterium]|nr:hypothetical protein [Pseudanabaenales cyanobacterium]
MSKKAERSSEEGEGSSKKVEGSSSELECLGLEGDRYTANLKRLLMEGCDEFGLDFIGNNLSCHLPDSIDRNHY